MFYVDIIYINVCRLGKKSLLYYLSHRRMGENQLLEPFGGQLLLDCQSSYGYYLRRRIAYHMAAYNNVSVVENQFAQPVATFVLGYERPWALSSSSVSPTPATSGLVYTTAGTALYAIVSDLPTILFTATSASRTAVCASIEKAVISPAA